MCSCGEERPHVIAERTTADGAAVCFWDDGLVALGTPSVRAPSGVLGAFVALDAAWLLADELALYDVTEVPRAIQAARAAVRTPDPIRHFRAAMNSPRP